MCEVFLQEHVSYKSVRTIAVSPLFAVCLSRVENSTWPYICPPDGAGGVVGGVEAGGAAGVLSVRGVT